MNITPAVLAVLRGASEALNNVEIREQIAALDDVKPIDAQHLVADAINQLVDAGQVERIWSEGRCTYVIAPDAPADFIGADPGIEVGATRHSGDPLPMPPAPPHVAEPEHIQVPAPAAAPPPPTAKANAMHATQQKIIDVITKAGAPLSTADLLRKMPNVNAPAFAKHRKQLCDDGAIIAHGSTSNRTYGLPGSPPPATIDAPPKVQKPKSAEPSSKAISAPVAVAAHADALSIADLRAAAVDILRSHGTDPLPRSLHRLVIAAVGAPESLAA